MACVSWDRAGYARADCRMQWPCPRGAVKQGKGEHQALLVALRNGNRSCPSWARRHWWQPPPGRTAARAGQEAGHARPVASPPSSCALGALEAKAFSRSAGTARKGLLGPLLGKQGLTVIPVTLARRTSPVAPGHNYDPMGHLHPDLQAGENPTAPLT